MRKVTQLSTKPMLRCFLAIVLCWNTVAAPAADEEESETQEAITILTEEVRKFPGPKRTIAVQRFSSSGSFEEVYGAWDVGAGMEAMLATALLETDQFILVERANLSDILSEQELAGSGMTGTGKSVAIGQLNSAQLMIYGAVTEFDTQSKSGGFNVGASSGSSLLGLGRSKSEGTIGLDVRIVDATTGRVLSSKHVKESVISKGFDITGGYEGITIGDSDFVQTPIGQAARAAITQVVQLIIEDAVQTEWKGQVVDYDGEDIYINAGTSAGIEEGNQFVIERISKSLTDPTTGEVLMVKTEKLGVVKVGMVTDKISFGKFVSVHDDSPTRGDMAVLPVQ